MVIQGDFKTELVEATTKTPFHEHCCEGETYVEVEPGAECCLSYQRVGIDTKEPVVSDPRADGKGIGWHEAHVGVPSREKKPRHWGARRRDVESQKDCIKTQEVSLKFVRPSIDQQLVADGPLVGTVEFKLCKDCGQQTSMFTTSSEFARSQTATMASAVATRAKPVRSEQGSTINAIAPLPGHRLGAHMQTITLHCCTVPFLIHLGILPKPPNPCAMHQIIKGKERTALPPLLVPPRQIVSRVFDSDGRAISDETKHCNFFDLSVLNSDSDDNSDS